MTIREFLMAIYGLGWFVVLIVTALRTKEPIPAELWAVLGIGEGGLLAAFRTDDRIGRRRSVNGRTDVGAGE